MFEENKEPVTNVTENTEETVEQTAGIESEPSINKTEDISVPEKLYTEEEFNSKLDDLLSKKIARKEAKIRKEYDKKYGQLENVLKAGTGETDVEALTNTFKDFYTKKGIEIPNYQSSNDYDMEAGAEKEAQSIINSGFDEVVEEVDRLSDLGLERMSARDKILFTKLASYRQKEENRKELASIGIKGEVLDSKEFNDFASQFNTNTPITKVYEIYKQTLPKENVENIGSMKNTKTPEAKDYYTPDEARRLTSKDLDDPVIMAAVEKSMARWYNEGIK